MPEIMSASRSVSAGNFFGHRVADGHAMPSNLRCSGQPSGSAGSLSSLRLVSAALTVRDVGVDCQRDLPAIFCCDDGIMIERCQKCGASDTGIDPIALPRDGYGRPKPESVDPHAQLGRKQGRSGEYDQAREFGKDGKLKRDIDFTNHGRKDHPIPHQHRYEPNETGGTARRLPAEPLEKPK